MTESILNLGTRLIDDGFDEFIMITADPHVLSRNKRKNMQNTRCSVRTLIFVANFFLLPRVCLALKDYRNLMPDTIGLIVFDNTEWTNFSSPTVHVVLMGIFIFIP